MSFLKYSDFELYVYMHENCRIYVNAVGLPFSADDCVTGAGYCFKNVEYNSNDLKWVAINLRAASAYDDFPFETV